MRPVRATSLSLRELADETVVYNADRDEATVLDAVSRRLFDACDGTREVAELALLTGLDRDACRVELHRLADAGLVTGVSALRSRRALLGGAAVVGGGLAIAPLVSVVLPQAAAAVSGGAVSGGTTPMLTVTRTAESCADSPTTTDEGTVQVTGSGFAAGTIAITYGFPSTGPISVNSTDGTFTFSASGQPACVDEGYGYEVTATDSAAVSQTGFAGSDCGLAA